MQPRTRERRVLIVDDERTIVDILARYLNDEGFEVAGVHDGAEALERALSETYDLILLDLTLPKLSGTEIFRQVRKVSDVPIIMVTSRAEDVDRIVGLELGADDYIAKPFNPREVVARVKNVLRHVEQRPAKVRVEHDVQRAGDLEIDRTGHEIRLRGQTLRVTPMEYRVLDALARNAGVALSRAQLLDIVNSDATEIYDRTLDKHIANLRAKIEADPTRPRYIVTVQGVGYKFVE